MAQKPTNNSIWNGRRKVNISRKGSPRAATDCWATQAFKRVQCCSIEQLSGEWFNNQQMFLNKTSESHQIFKPTFQIRTIVNMLQFQMLYALLRTFSADAWVDPNGLGWGCIRPPAWSQGFGSEQCLSALLRGSYKSVIISGVIYNMKVFGLCVSFSYPAKRAVSVVDRFGHFRLFLLHGQ